MTWDLPESVFCKVLVSVICVYILDCVLGEEGSMVGEVWRKLDKTVKQFFTKDFCRVFNMLTQIVNLHEAG